MRLFEAAACGTPIVSDAWPGLECFFAPGSEILVAKSTEDVLAYLADWREDDRIALGQRAHRRVLAEHSAAHRAEALEAYTTEVLGRTGGVLPSQATASPTL